MHHGSIYGWVSAVRQSKDPPIGQIDIFKQALKQIFLLQDHGSQSNDGGGQGQGEPEKLIQGQPGHVHAVEAEDNHWEWPAGW